MGPQIPTLVNSLEVQALIHYQSRSSRCPRPPPTCLIQKSTGKVTERSQLPRMNLDIVY
jgi:hypothetical protein